MITFLQLHRSYMGRFFVSTTFVFLYYVQVDGTCHHVEKDVTCCKDALSLSLSLSLVFPWRHDKGTQRQGTELDCLVSKNQKCHACIGFLHCRCFASSLTQDCGFGVGVWWDLAFLLRVLGQLALDRGYIKSRRTGIVTVPISTNQCDETLLAMPFLIVSSY